MDLCTHYATMHEYINNNIMRNCMKYDYEVLFEEGWLDTIGKGIGDAWKTGVKWVSSNWKNIIKWIFNVWNIAVNWLLNLFNKNRRAIHNASRYAMQYIRKLCDLAVKKISQNYKENESVDNTLVKEWCQRLNIHIKTTANKEDDTTKIFSFSKLDDCYNKMYDDITPQFSMDIASAYPGTDENLAKNTIDSLNKVRTLFNNIKDYYEDNIFVTDLSFYNNLAVLRTNVAKQMHYIKEIFKLYKAITDTADSDIKEAYNNLFDNSYDYLFETTPASSNILDKKSSTMDDNEKKVFGSKGDDDKENTKRALLKSIQGVIDKITKTGDQLQDNIKKKLNSSPFESICSAKCLSVVNEYLNNKTNLIKERITEITELMREKKSGFTFKPDEFKESEIKEDLKELGTGINVDEVLKAEFNFSGKEGKPFAFDDNIKKKLFEAMGITRVTTDWTKTVELYNTFEKYFVGAYWYFHNTLKTFDKDLK